MKEYEIGDVIPIYEVPMDELFFRMYKADVRPQQRPQDTSYNAVGCVKIDCLTFLKGTEHEHTDSAIVWPEDLKPIGQMRIKKLK